MALSRSQEDYLSALLQLSKKDTHIRVTDLAKELNISKPSVNKAITLLKAQGLVEQEKYGDIYLTTVGQCLAKNVQKRHQVLRDFLQAIGVEDKKAETEACAIEHNISIDTAEKLAKFMGWA